MNEYPGKGVSRLNESEGFTILDDNLGIREQTERIERLVLCPYATLSCNSLGRDRKEPPCEMRTVFQRDRDRIIHPAVARDPSVNKNRAE